VAEETGFADVTLGPLIWRREAVYRDRKQRPWRLKESYFVARCDGGEISRSGWQALEQEFVDDIRWWTLDALAASPEPVFPEILADLLRRVLAGEFADVGPASKS
jgi:ADP-ribose pyrophosphatase YjhB (NUDIX family)